MRLKVSKSRQTLIVVTHEMNFPTDMKWYEVIFNSANLDILSSDFRLELNFVYRFAQPSTGFCSFLAAASVSSLESHHLLISPPR